MNILCPVCKKIITKQEKAYKCINGHNFDIAKEGYLNLNMHKSQNTGDNQTMIKARQSFLDKNYYQFLRDRINELLNEESSLIDLACGEGYYTSAFKCIDKIGIDLSKSGLKIASKKDKNTTYLLNSIFHNPLEDKCADYVITIFAPVAKEEIYRLLKDDGRFILVKPDVDHLFELKKVLYDNPYLNAVEDIVIPQMEIEKEIKIKDTRLLDHHDIMNLFMMTPYFNTTSSLDKQKLNDIDQLEITFSFIIDVYKKAN